MNNVARFSGTIYPDKTFTLGIVPKTKRSSAEIKFDHSWNAQPEMDYSAYTDWLLGTVNVGGSFCSLSESPDAGTEVLRHQEGRERDIYVLSMMDRVQDGDFSQFYDVEPPSEAPLLVKSLKLSRKPRNPYGQNGITTYGKRLVKNATLLLERKYGKGRLGFVTCSLPNLPERSHHAVNSVWGEIVRRFYQKLRRQLEKLSQPFIYVGVTEIQEKRFKKHGIPAPHLHFVYLSRAHSRQRYWLYICQIHRAWAESLQEGLAHAGDSYSLLENQSWGGVHAQVVQKSAAAYLGKYMSKGCKVLEAMQEQGWNEFPKQWWSACKEAKKMFHESLIKIPQDICSMLFYDAEELLRLEMFAYMQSIWVEVGGYTYRCGITGTLSYELYRALSP